MRIAPPTPQAPDIARGKPAVLLSGLHLHRSRNVAYQLRQSAGMRHFRTKYKSARKEMGSVDHWQDVRAGLAVSCQLAGRIKMMANLLKANQLHTLSLSGEALGDAGARMVGNAISACSVLASVTCPMSYPGTFCRGSSLKQWQLTHSTRSIIVWRPERSGGRGQGGAA